MKNIFLALLIMLPISGFALEQDVPLRVDLGVEVCKAGISICSKTPFSGENISLKLVLVEKNPETWLANWSSKIAYGTHEFEGRVQLKVIGTPSGYSFDLKIEAEKSATRLWLNHLGELPHLESRGEAVKINDATVTPYVYVSRPLK